jgi:hypothetical protein
MVVSLTVSMVGDPSRELRFTLEPLHEAVGSGTWTKQQENGLGVQPSTGYWSYGGAEGEIWLSESSDVFCAIRVDSSWSNALLEGTTVLGQGWLQRTSQGDMEVLYRLEATS